MRYPFLLPVIGILVLILTALVGYFLMAQTSSPVSDTPDTQSEAIASISRLSDRTLAGFQKTGVVDLDGPYKKVTAYDGKTTFSFEVPDEWLVELRNTGEIPMNEEELRGFFGDYWDFSDEQLAQKTMGDFLNIFQEIEAETSAGFPLMSVAASDRIYYIDGNIFQTDFYLYPTSMAQKEILNSKKQEAEDFEEYASRYSEEIAKTLQTKWEEGFIDGKSVIIAHEQLEVLENGERLNVATKGRPGGEEIYINLGVKTLLIRKQGFTNSELLENNFRHLISTFKFE